MTELPRADAERIVADCRYCPKMCRFACPVAEADASEAATPTWKGTLVHAWLRGQLPLAGSVAEAAYRCTDCLLQREACLWEHAVPQAYGVARAAAFAAGVAPERARSFAERVRRLGNPFEEGLSARLAGAVGAADLVGDGGRADVLLFPGCTAVRHDLDLVRDARGVVARVERAPLRCAASGAGCCGLPLFMAGDLEGFRTLAARTAGALAGAAEVVTLDPGCAVAMETFWPKVGVRLAGRVRTLVERLGERLDAVRAAVRAPVGGERLAYHDPCYLGRHRGVYDAPRSLLAAACGGRPPVELPSCRERAWCSGGGGDYPRIFPESADRIRDRRLAEHAECGADRLTTACPSARRRFERGLPPDTRPMDVLSVLARAVGIMQPPKHDQ